MGEPKDAGRPDPEMVEDLEVSDADAEEIAGGDSQAPAPPKEYLKVTMTNVIISG